MSTNTNRTILITGGAGFVGSHLAATLLAAGHKVVVVDNLSTGCKEFVPEGAEFIKVDVRDGLSQIIDHNIDVVFHLAAQVNVRESIANPTLDADMNISGTISVVECSQAMDVDQFIFFSTGGAIYDPEDALPPDETSAIAPRSPYGLAKHTAERYVQMLADDISCTILRPSNIYGPRQGGDGEAGVIAVFAQKAVSGEELEVYGDGEQTRDFVFVQDVVRAAKSLMQAQASGIYNVSTGVQTSVNEVVEAIRTTTNNPVSVVKSDPIPGEIRHSVLSPQKLQETIQWSPQVNITEGIKRTISYAKNKSN